MSDADRPPTCPRCGAESSIPRAALPAIRAAVEAFGPVTITVDGEPHCECGRPSA